MTGARAEIILAAVLAYLLLCVVVGLWALRRTHSTQDFFMAGRSLGILVTSLALFSSTMSGFGFIGGPGLVYQMGTSSLWIVAATSIGYVVAFALLAKPLRAFAELRNPVSLPDVLAARYRSEGARFLTGLAILLGVLGYLATQILAMAMVLREVFAAVDGLPAVSLEAAVAISTGILVFYCVTGGIIASVYTDVVQGGIMVVAAIFVFLAARAAFDGGFAGMSEAIAAHDPAAIGPWGTLGVFGCLSWYLLFGLGMAGQPHIVTKLMMSRELENARRMLPLSIGSYALAALLWIGVGLVMRALVVEGLHPPLDAPDEAAPAFLYGFAHPVLAGIVFAGLFAAIMSTADSFLNIGAAAIVHDIPTAVRGRKLERELLWARIGTVVLATLAALFALYSHYEHARVVALLGAFGWGTFAAALVPTVAIGLNWKRGTATAANVAIGTSLVLNLGIELFDIRLPGDVHGGTLALLVSTALFLGISFLSRPPELDDDVAAVLDL